MSQTTTDDRQSGWLALFGTMAMTALAIAIVAIIIAGDETTGAATAAAPTHVSLTEFALTPSAITVPEGGSLHVTNDGSTAHNLAIIDQDLATADIASGGSEVLDLSSLPVGTYEVLCQISGHADSGMTGTLEVTSGDGGAAAPDATSMPGMDMASGATMTDAGVIGYSLNGKSFPATAPIVGNRGDWIEIHYANEGTQIHPMHLHQFDQIVIAKDGYPLDEPYVVDTLNIAPGERYTVLVELEQRGTWVWHCHILPHVERESGMYGMVTAVVVQ